MNDDTRAGRSARYRDQAAACRLSAEESPTLGGRDDYLRMATEWEKLADEVVAWSSRIGEGKG